MSGEDSTYQQSNIYGKQGGNETVVKENGIFTFYQQSFTGKKLKAGMRQAEVVTMINSAGVLSDQGDGTAPPILPSTAGLILVSATGAMSNGSARLASGVAGQELLIQMSPAEAGSTASLLIYASGHASGISGVVVYGSAKTALSSISMRQSAGSYGWVHLKAIADGTWAIIDASTQVTENLSA